MRIVLFEDNGSALFVEDWLRDEKHEVWRTMDFRDIMSWAEFKPGVEAFDAWVFDLNVPADTLKRAEENEPYDESKHHSPSLYFINNYLLKKYSNLEKKIILFSAYFSQYDRQGWDLGGYLRVDKNSQQVAEEFTVVLETVKERSK